MKYYCPIIIGSRTLSPTRDSREETLDLHELDNLIEQELVNGFNEDFALRIEHRPSTSSCPPGPCPNYADIAAGITIEIFIKWYTKYFYSKYLSCLYSWLGFIYKYWTTTVL